MSLVGSATGVEMPDPSTVYQRARIGALRRIASDLRGQLADAPRDDPDVAGILKDCDTLDEIAQVLSRSVKVAPQGLQMTTGPR